MNEMKEEKKGEGKKKRREAEEETFDSFSSSFRPNTVSLPLNLIYSVIYTNLQNKSRVDLFWVVVFSCTRLFG
jgi:hypothetical protein